jgi:hypothetical protein
MSPNKYLNRKISSERKGGNTVWPGAHLQPRTINRTAQKAQSDVAVPYPTRYLLAHRHVAPQPTVFSGSTQ